MIKQLFFRPQLRNGCKALSFLLLLGLSLSVLARCFSGSSSYGDARGFYAEPANSLELVMIGNSDAYSGFSPMELWNGYGYTSYVCGESRQTLAASTQLLREVLSCQRPRVVILETDGIFTRTAHLLADTLVQLLPPFLRESDWSQRRFSPIAPAPSSVCTIDKGQYVSTHVEGYHGGDYLARSPQKRRISTLAQWYLGQMNQLCQAHGATLLLVQIPSASSWTQAKHNAVQDYADRHGLTFLDLDANRSRFSFDWTQDSRDGGNHLNAGGARKVTLYLGDLLKREFSLTDRRQDPDYQMWAKTYRAYKKELS